MRHTPLGTAASGVRAAGRMAVLLATVVSGGCGGPLSAPEGELPSAQIAALFDAFDEMGVWAAPGALSAEAPTASFDCTGGGGIDLVGSVGAVEDGAVDYAFELSVADCHLAGGGTAFSVGGSLSGEGGYSASADIVLGSYTVGGTLYWAIEDRLGECIVSVEVGTAYAPDEDDADARSVDGTLCGFPVGDFP